MQKFSLLITEHQGSVMGRSPGSIGTLKKHKKHCADVRKSYTYVLRHEVPSLGFVQNCTQ